MWSDWTIRRVSRDDARPGERERRSGARPFLLHQGYYGLHQGHRIHCLAIAQLRDSLSTRDVADESDDVPGRALHYHCRGRRQHGIARAYSIHHLTPV